MGMFDNIRCHYPRPDGWDRDVVFQTKDTPRQWLEMYEITTDGRLLNPDGEYEDFHGDLNFYWGNVSGCSPKGVITEDDKPPESADYTALFNHGQLISLEGKHQIDGDRNWITRDEFWDRSPQPGREEQP